MTAIPPFVPWEPHAQADEVATRPPRSLLWAQRGLWLGALSFAVAGVGQALLSPEETRGLGLALLGVGIVLAVLAWNGSRDAPLLVAKQGRLWWRLTWRPALLLRLGGIGAAAALAVASILAYTQDPFAIFGWQGALWLASMALLLISCARWYPRTQRESDVAPPWSRTEGLLFYGLLALSLFTHMAFLQEIPWRFHFDEGYAFTETMRYYRGPVIPLFTTTWHDTSLPSIWFSFAAGWMHLLGPGLAGVRAGVAFVGAMTVIPVYGLARLVWGRLAAGLAGFAVAVSAVHVHYSRVSIINVTTAFAWAVCFYFLLRGLRSRRPGDFAWSGLAAGLSIYTYYGARLLPYLLLAFLGYLLVFHFRAARERLGHFALLGAGFLVGFGPLLGYFINHPAMWTSRAATFMNVPPVIPTTWQGWVDNWNTLAPLAARNFLGLGTIPGRDTVYYAPFLLPPEAVLVVLGAGLLLWRWRQPASLLFLVWGLSPVLTGGTLLDHITIPNFARWSPGFPAFYLAMALPLSLWLKAVLAASHGWRWRRLAARPVGVTLLALLLATHLTANAYAYLAHYPPKVPPDKSLEAAQGRFLESLGADAQVRIVGAAWQELYPDVAEMMAPGVRAANLINPSRELPLVADPQRDLVFLFYNDAYDYLPVVQHYYPGGELSEVRTPDDALIAQSYKVHKEKALAQHGVLVALESGATGKVSKIGALPDAPGQTETVVATWSGAFYTPQPGPLTLSTEGVERDLLWVQGQPVVPGVPVEVEPGWIRFVVKGQVARGSRPARLLVQEGDVAPYEIDTPRLWPMPPEQGIAVTMSAVPLAHRIDPFIGSTRAAYRGGTLPLAATGNLSTQIRWEGQLLTTEGTYVMELRTDARALLLVDGVPQVMVCPVRRDLGNVTSATPVHLTAGWHTIRIDYQAMGYRNGLEWFWTRPDGVREVVPPSALRIADAVQVDRSVPFPERPAPVPCAP